MKNYNHLKIEKKWQKEWSVKKIYQAKNPSAQTGNLKKNKFYGLMEFPYPSGDGLHVGHVRGYTAMDIISRQKRMEGYNTLFPIGWDAFGLPTENYAIKTGKQPKLITQKNTDNFKKQFNLLGMSFDWSREINTTDPAYYRWTQWIFLQFFKKGLAYKKKVEINWCLNCKIGLANEEAINNLCERCGGEVVKKEKEQWMLGITKYADRLDQDLDLVDYPERVKSSQRNWIGKSEGSEIEFKIHLPPAPSEGRGEEISKEGEFGYQTTDAKTWKILQDSVIKMRQNPTEAEEILWQLLRKNLTGYHFRRQQIIGKFIVDFVCISKKLVIEVDGDIHDLQKEKDDERTKILKLSGFKVIRFKNEEVIKDINSVIKKIEEELKVLPFGEDLGGVKVFTTRADTLFGATYVVLAPEHPLLLSKSLFDNIENKKEVEDYIKKVKSKSDLERTENKEKTGVELKGVKAINPAFAKSYGEAKPANLQSYGEAKPAEAEIPIWVADYVLPHYGTGAVMAVPAHDERDFEFAKKYNLPIRQVVEPLFVKNLNKDFPIVERNAISAIIKHWSEDKYLCLKWKKVDWVTFVTGGIEKGQTSEDAARAEILEETGFFNLKLIRILPKIHSKFFHVPKNENRFGHFNSFYFELENGEQKEIIEEEKSKHEIIWLKSDEINKFLVTDGEKLNFKILNNEQYVHTEYGILNNSGKFNGLESSDAIKEITKFVGGKIVTKYKLRDWVFSRQRYWGEPIPLVFCKNCAEQVKSGKLKVESEGEKLNPGWFLIKDKDLPVKLPEVKNYKPTDNGESPLANISKWVNVKCPKCKGPAKRETDTMPNWAGSSWYYLRYTDPKNKKVFADQKKLKYWLGGARSSEFKRSGVDWYNGGMEHTTLHLLYSRFWHKFLYDLKLVPNVEPYQKRTSHGMILAEGGVKMSKSKGNVINPDDIIKIYGSDTLRIYEMFIGPFEDTAVWNTESIIGSRRFVEKVWRIGEKVFASSNFSSLRPSREYTGGTLGKLKIERSSDLENSSSRPLEKLLNKTIKKVTEDIQNMRFNTAISAMMILATEIEKIQGKTLDIAKGYNFSVDDFKKFLQILAPFAPHVTEELWFRLGNKKSIHLSPWPSFDLNLIKDDEVKIVIQVNGKVRAEMLIGVDLSEEEIKNLAQKNENVLKFISGQEIKKIIYVKNRLVSIVV